MVKRCRDSKTARRHTQYGLLFLDDLFLFVIEYKTQNDKVNEVSSPTDKPSDFNKMRLN